MLTDSELDEVMCVLGLDARDFMAVRGAGSIEEAVGVLRVLKDKARRGFRKAALHLHPDHNGGDAEKTALFIRAKSVVDHIEGMRVRERPRPVPVQRVRRSVVFRQSGGVVFASTGGSTTSTTVSWPGQRVWVKVI